MLLGKVMEVREKDGDRSVTQQQRKTPGAPCSGKGGRLPSLTTPTPQLCSCVDRRGQHFGASTGSSLTSFCVTINLSLL